MAGLELATTCFVAAAAWSADAAFLKLRRGARRDLLAVIRGMGQGCRLLTNATTPALADRLAFGYQLSCAVVTALDH